MKQSFAKGETILEGQGIAVVPLFVEVDDALLEQLPHFVACTSTGTNSSSSSSLEWMSAAVLDYRNTLLRSIDDEDQSSSGCLSSIIVVALHLLFDPAEKVRQFVAESIHHKPDIFDRQDESYNVTLAIDTWQQLQTHIKYDLKKWINLVYSVAERLVFISMIHPIYRYAEHVMPQLSAKQLTKAIKVLGLTEHQPHSTQSVLRYMKDV
jgi:hypothetical protein